LASRSYEVSDQSLVVRCRGEIVGDIPLETIVAFRIRGRVSGWSFFSSVGGHEKLPGDGHKAARWRT
jgi:hypothetical protein